MTPLVVERLINAPAERVWRALTDSNDLKQWSPFLPDFKAEVGFKVEFMLGPDKAHQYRHFMEVTEVVAGQKLTYTWRYGGYSGSSYVTLELFPDGDKTRLRLTHTITEPFPAIEAFRPENFTQGWNYTVDAVKKFVETSTV